MFTRAAGSTLLAYYIVLDWVGNNNRFRGETNFFGTTFLRWGQYSSKQKSTRASDQVTTFHKGDKQGINQQNFY